MNIDEITKKIEQVGYRNLGERYQFSSAGVQQINHSNGAVTREYWACVFDTDEKGEMVRTCDPLELEVLMHNKLTQLSLPLV